MIILLKKAQTHKKTNVSKHPMLRFYENHKLASKLFLFNKETQVEIFIESVFGKSNCSGNQGVRPFLMVDVVMVVDASTTATALLCRPYDEKNDVDEFHLRCSEKVNVDEIHLRHFF
jgi:hypothetical protein